MAAQTASLEQQAKIKQLQTLTFLQGSLLSRISHFGRLGYQFEGDRNIYEALGYKEDLDWMDYYTQYQRQDIANAVINIPVRTTWRGEIKLLESSDDEETPLEKEWKALNKQFGFRSVFARLDRLVCLNHYGILLLGLDDTKGKDVFRNPVAGGKRKLLYVKPFGEESASVLEWDRDSSSPRYGHPTLYQVSVPTPDGAGSQDIAVHFTRVIHVPGEDILDNELSGSPKLEVVFNRLKDLEKLVGGSAEMFWRGARPGYQGKVDPDYQMTAETEEDLQDQIDEYEHNLRRILVNQGVDLQSLATQVADPSSHVDIQIQMISTVTGIPKRILTGSERGELASTQDRDNWFDRIQSRREEYCGPLIVRPFVDRCIELGIIPPLKKKDDEYTVEWTSLYTQSEIDMANLGKIRAETLKSYASAPTNQDIIPPDAFLRLMLNLDDEEIELIEEQQEAMAKEEAEDMKEEEAAEKKPEEKPEEKEEVTEEEPLTQGGPGSGNHGHSGGKGGPGNPGGSSGKGGKVGVGKTSSGIGYTSPTTEADKALMATMQSMNEMIGQTNNYELVLDNGKFFTPPDGPPEKKMADNECYRNAGLTAIENSAYTYVEGFATTKEIGAALPFAHAWLVDKKGKVVDPTWKTPGASYFGVPFTTKHLTKTILQTEVWGMIPDYPRKGYDPLRKGFPKGAIVE